MVLYECVRFMGLFTCGYFVIYAMLTYTFNHYCYLSGVFQIYNRGQYIISKNSRFDSLNNKYYARYLYLIKKNNLLSKYFLQYTTACKQY